MQTIEAEPRAVRLPASFWNGRRRVALSYCRTIHKAQGSTLVDLKVRSRVRAEPEADHGH